MIPLPDAMSMLGAGLLSVAGVAFLASLDPSQRGRLDPRPATTGTLLRRTSLALALIGLVLIAVFAPRIAH